MMNFVLIVLTHALIDWCHESPLDTLSLMSPHWSPLVSESHEYPVVWVSCVPIGLSESHESPLVSCDSSSLYESKEFPLVSSSHSESN